MAKKRKPIPVFVAVLTQGTVTVQVASILNQIVADALTKKEYEPTIHFSKHTGVDFNRNMITKQFLQSNCEYLLMMDDDNPPLKNPLELLTLKKDVLVYPTLMYKGDVGKLAFNVFKEVRINGRKDWQTMVYDGKNKTFKVDRAGAGCILIKRKVLENIKAPFETKRSKDGLRIVGEDMFFSDKVWKAGFQIWGHWDYVCSHYKTLDLLSVADIIIKAKTNEKGFRDTTPNIIVR